MAFRCALERGNERDRSRFMASSLRTSERPLFCFGKSELLPFSPFPFLFWYHSRHWKFQNKLSLTDRHGHPYAGGVFTHRWVGLVRAPLLGPRNRFGRKGSYGGAVFFRNPPKLVRGGRRRTWSKLGAAAERSRERENGRFICYPKEARTFL